MKRSYYEDVYTLLYVIVANHHSDCPTSVNFGV